MAPTFRISIVDIGVAVVSKKNKKTIPDEAVVAAALPVLISSSSKDKNRQLPKNEYE